MGHIFPHSNKLSSVDVADVECGADGLATMFDLLQVIAEPKKTERKSLLKRFTN